MARAHITCRTWRATSLSGRAVLRDRIPIVKMMGERARILPTREFYVVAHGASMPGLRGRPVASAILPLTSGSSLASVLPGVCLIKLVRTTATQPGRWVTEPSSMPSFLRLSGSMHGPKTRPCSRSWYVSFFLSDENSVGVAIHSA